MLRPLQTHFLLFQQIFFVLVCTHPGTPRVPLRVLVSWSKPCGGNKWEALKGKRKKKHVGGKKEKKKIKDRAFARAES